MPHWIGIDPGKEGVVARLNQDGVFSLKPIEELLDKDGLLIPEALRDYVSFLGEAPRGIALEVQKPQPGRFGARANFHLGYQTGGWSWALKALGYSPIYAYPADWQRQLLLPEERAAKKRGHVAAAKRLIGYLGKDHNEADALLLAFLSMNRHGALKERLSSPATERPHGIS
jgi:hypothetical protein